MQSSDSPTTDAAGASDSQPADVPADVADSLQRALRGVRASAQLELGAAASRLDELHRELKSALANLDRT